MAKRKNRTVKLYTDVGRDMWVKPKWDDAKRAVDLRIILTDSLVNRCRRGIPWECVIAEGIKDAVRRNPDLFPHPCLYPYVQRRTIYIVDKINGMPVHAVRYQHDFSHLTFAFDTITKQRFQRVFGEAGFNLHMRPVKKRGGDELPGARETRERTHSVGEKKPAALRGAYCRARDAGLAIPETRHHPAPNKPQQPDIAPTAHH